MQSVATKAAAVEAGFAVECHGTDRPDLWTLAVTANNRAAMYWCEEVCGGPCARGFRLTKMAERPGDRTTYTVYLATDGSGETQCDCPDAAYRGHVRQCRHVRGVLAASVAGCLDRRLDIEAEEPTVLDETPADCGGCGRAGCPDCVDMPF